MIYSKLGVSASKEDVYTAIKDLDKGLFPGSFCKAIPDTLTGSSDHCILTHADGSGSKSILAYMHYMEHHDANIFKGIAQDSLVMNLDDLLCVGATGPFILSNTIGRNSKIIPGEIIKAIISGYEEVCSLLRDYNIDIISCGGETADIGDIIRTVVIDSTITTRMKRNSFINCKDIKSDHVIVGLASFGQASYETSYNSGIGTNGLTALRHGLFCKQSPETYAPEIERESYQGRFDIHDKIPGTNMNILEASLSPTRTYAPIIVQVLKEYKNHISAMFHNTGGGQTKSLHYTNKKIIKNNLFPLEPLFSLLKNEKIMPLQELFQVFNMGHRFEIVCDDNVANDIINISKSFNVDAQIVGYVENGNKSMEIHYEDYILHY